MKSKSLNLEDSVYKVDLSFQVVPELHKEIVQLSHELELSISQLTRKALKQFIANHQKGVSEDD